MLTAVGVRVLVSMVGAVLLVFDGVVRMRTVAVTDSGMGHAVQTTRAAPEGGRPTAPVIDWSCAQASPQRRSRSPLRVTRLLAPLAESRRNGDTGLCPSSMIDLHGIAQFRRIRPDDGQACAARLPSYLARDWS
jgi:hypothetical protein